MLGLLVGRRQIIRLVTLILLTLHCFSKQSLVKCKMLGLLVGRRQIIRLVTLILLTLHCFSKQSLVKFKMLGLFLGGTLINFLVTLILLTLHCFSKQSLVKFKMLGLFVVWRLINFLNSGILQNYDYLGNNNNNMADVFIFTNDYYSNNVYAVYHFNEMVKNNIPLPTINFNFLARLCVSIPYTSNAEHLQYVRVVRRFIEAARDQTPRYKVGYHMLFALLETFAANIQF
jgi:uncharacterized membrane protein